ncbi:autotransporter-associated beta strand repeat-containing protein [Dyella agri]|uniref:Autotransporter-associated beta strand repeat-containing protein n=1 Tax=Dyella agri TaxID=1926869 RepID=A0ABW8KG74_9GAMM
MSDRKCGLRPCAVAFAVALALGLSGCGDCDANIKPTQPPQVGGSDFAGGNVNVNAGNATVWPADISGSIDLVKVGAGTLVLTGTDSYTGGTTVSAGTLQLGNGGTSGVITGDVIDNGSLVFDRSDNVTFTGIISGSGSLVQAGTGTLTLTGKSTYTGATAISAGTLALTGSASLASSAGVSDAGTFDISGTSSGATIVSLSGNGTVMLGEQTLTVSNAAGTFGGVIKGSGDLRLAGGTEILTGANAYTGGTTISGGILQLGGGGTSGAITGDVIDNGSLVFDRSDSVSFSGIISGNGSLTQAGTGTLTLTGDNTCTGGATISAGTLQLGNGGVTGMVAGNLTDNGSLIFDRSDDVSFSGFAAGSGTLTQAGTGTLTLTGNNTYTGGTTISAGILQLGNGGVTGAITGNVVDNGSLIFDRSDDVSFGGAVTGSGSLTQAGTGMLTLTGTNTYTGGTTISAGILRFGDGIRTGSVAGDITDNASLVFSPSSNLSYAGMISGSGSLVKAGGGTLKLTGVSSYAGGTTVSGGVLEIAAGAVPGAGSITVFGIWPSSNPDQMLQVDSGASLSNQIVLDGFGVLNNAGKLSGNLGAAVKGADPFVTIVNHDGGIIEGNASAVAFFSNGTVENSSGGIIEGGSFGVVMNDGGTVSNDGAGSIIRSPGGMAVQVSGETGVVTNTGGGTIMSSLTPVYLQHGGTVTNGAGSTIETTAARSGDCASTGICSIFVAWGDSTVSTFDGGLTLSNAGSIIGNVQMIQAARNYVTLSAGGSIHGNLLIGSNSASLLMLNGDAGTVQLYSQAVTGATTFAGLFRKSGDGRWIIDNNELDSSSSTEIDGGTLQVGNGAAEGSIGQGTIKVLGGSLVFDRSDDLTFQGQIVVGQSGALVQAGTGTLILTGNTFSGPASGVTIKSGALQVGDGGTAGMLSGDVANNGSLVFDRGDNVAFNGVISGTGSLTQQGAGTLTLYADNTYTGDTVVNNGMLRALSTLPGNVIVNAGAVLDGASYYGAPPGVFQVAGNLSNAGTVAVHGRDSTVIGDYVQSSTGTLAVSLGSKLTVLGAAKLNGGILEVTGADSGYISNVHTNVLTTGRGVSGTFSQLVKDAGVVFIATTINYDASSVWLDTTGLNVTTAAAGAGVSYTPASMGSALRVQAAFEQLDSKIATDNLSSVSSNFLRAAGQFQQAPTLQAAQASLQSLSGELHAASAAMTFEAIDASSRALSDRFDKLLGKEASFGAWTQSLDMGGSMARTGYDGVGFQLNGWLVGSDRQIGHSGVAGFAFGQSQGLQQTGQGFGRDNSRSTESMVYAGWSDGNWYTQGRVGFGHLQQDVNRQVLLGYNTQGVSTQYSSNFSVAYGESGLYLNYRGTRITPFANVEYASIKRGGFAEQGASGFGLQSEAQTTTRWQAGLGVRASRHWNLGDGRAVDFSARAQWQRTLATRGDVFDASFVGVQQWQPLTGIGLSRYSGLLGLGLDATLSARAALNFGYDYEVGQRESAQILSARLNVAF